MWDVCAGHAIIVAMGGILCTLQGLPLIYDPQAENYFNENGFVCVINQQLLPYIISHTSEFSIK
jgi:3'-phosphoadenosine 5'-phosphosulfate (PAPS) 3'-phosphatase